MENLRKSKRKKIYAFILKGEENIYAFTDNIYYKNLFIKSRNMKKFLYMKLKLNEDEYNVFKDNNYLSNLDVCYLSDNERIDNYITTVATLFEHNKMDAFIDDLSKELMSDRIMLCNNIDDITKTELDAINYLTDINNSLNHQFANYNTLLIFYSLFGDLMKG